jgi:MoaA/NifB/PqqE/SkfB family radical SAM enzyme
MKTALYVQTTKALSRALRTPQYLILFVSNSCWMKCNHCWFNEEWKETNLTSNMLTLAELSRMADSIDRIAFLSLTGGEAFGRRDIVEITAMFAEKTRLSRYQIPTSGYKPEMIAAKAIAMLEANRGIPFRVDVSLDGTEEVHERVRAVPGGFNRVVETVRALNALKREYAYFDVGVITTISTYNQHQVHEIADVVEDINPDGEWMVNIVRGEVRDQSCVDVDPENYYEAHRIIEQRIASGRYRGHSGHRSATLLSAKNATRRKVIKSILDGQCAGGGCAAGALGGVIYSDGTVKPCELLTQSFGNIRDFDYDLRALWNSREGDNIRRWIQETRCQCTQECFLSVSLLIQPNHWPNMLHQWMRLKNAHRQAKHCVP